MPVDFRTLPPGSVICGWCDAFEAKAQKAEADAAAKYAWAIDTLREIARTPRCAEGCRTRTKKDWSRWCTRCKARQALKAHKPQAGSHAP